MEKLLEEILKELKEIKETIEDGNAEIIEALDNLVEYEDDEECEEEECEEEKVIN